MGFLSGLGKLAGSAALGVAKGAALIVEDACVAMNMNDVGELVHDVRSKAAEKSAELTGKEYVEPEMASGSIVNGFLDRGIDKYEKMVDDYEKNSLAPDYDKINEAREKIDAARNR